MQKMDQNLIKKWLIVQIRPNSSDLAIRNLERQGFETFMPKMKVTIKKENKFINKEVFVFPGYAFIGVDLQSSYWTKINSTYGVSKLLSFSNKPSEISLDLIVALKNRYEDKINTIINENLKKGDTIKFNDGPFTDLVANIESVDAKNRIYVLLEVMGGHRRLEINLKEKINFIKT
jgi:transcriptional antiterminator RfaH